MIPIEPIFRALGALIDLVIEAVEHWGDGG